MPRITPKSPELLQAQVAAYTAECVDSCFDTKDANHILKNISSIAAGKTVDVSRIEVTDYDYDKELGYLSCETEVHVASAENYVRYLCEVGGSAYDGIYERARMLARYNDDFKPVLSELLDEISTVKDPESHPDFISSGAYSNVYRFHHDGKDYAVRVPDQEQPATYVIDDHLSGPIRGLGIPHLEQIVAASYEDEVTIAEIIPGKEMCDLTIDEMKSITGEQLVELIYTLDTAIENGVLFDLNTRNFLYDPDAGFGMVDYWAYGIGDKDSIAQDIGIAAGWMAIPILNAGQFGGYNPHMTVEEYAACAEQLRVNYEVLKRYAKVVEEHLDSGYNDIAQEKILKLVTAYKELVAKHSDYISHLKTVDA
jgi:hypothetical protein